MLVKFINNSTVRTSAISGITNYRLKFTCRINYGKIRGVDLYIIKICESVLEEFSKKEDFDEFSASREIGEVYLYKSGRYYKIGKTNDTVRRGQEIKIQLPERTDLIHSIKTDDPSGVEAYWHKRFEAKRMQGEWFDLNSADVKVFKSWKKIV